MKIKTAIEITGGLSSPSKMPCKAWGIPAAYCATGSFLRSQPGSVCSRCYACKGRYVFPDIVAAGERSLQCYNESKKEKWINAMMFLINHQSQAFFRWFDTGDLQSLEMLDDIISIALYMPKTRFWLPTKEHNMFIGKRLPDNLCVRFANHYIDDFSTHETLPNACVSSTSIHWQGHKCHATWNGTTCGPCRACWNKEIKTVTYKLH